MRAPVLAGPGRGVVMDFRVAHHKRMVVGLMELEVARHVRALAFAGAVTFDVGAQDGYYTLTFAKLTGAQTVAFDLDCARLRRNVALNPGLTSLIEIREQRVGAKEGRRLDEVGVDPRLVKVDVDGGEARVLTGSRRLLAEVRPAWIVEVHSPELERECGRKLVDHGYRIRIVNQRRLFPDRRPIPHNRWLVATP